MSGDKLIAIELLVVSSNESRNKPGSGWKTRVVQYAKAGKSISVKLETGEYWTGDDGISRFKAKGFTAKDLDALKPHWTAIMKLLKNPPPVVEPEAASKPDEEVPFS